MSLEPTNGAARKEIDTVTNLCMTKKPLPPTSTARQRVVIEETDSSSDDDDASNSRFNCGSSIISE